MRTQGKIRNRLLLTTCCRLCPRAGSLQSIQRSRAACASGDLPSSAIRAVSELTFPGSQRAQLLADAVDLSIDLAAGRGSFYLYGESTLVDTGISMPSRLFDPVASLYTWPDIVKTFQLFQAGQILSDDFPIMVDRFSGNDDCDDC